MQNITQTFMAWGYDILLNFATWAIGTMARCHGIVYRSLSIKTRLFIDGQRATLPAIREAISGQTVDYWFHAASLGEFGIARPIMNKLHEAGYKTVLTFFSSTGVEALKGKNAEYTGADYVFYLPADCKKNVNEFLDIVNPQKAVFIKSEFWPNYLKELNARDIPTYLVSAYITPKSSLFKWYGGMFRELLNVFTRIYTQDEESVAHLDLLGYHDAIVIGDSLYDNAVANSKVEYKNQIIENFCNSAAIRAHVTTESKQTEASLTLNNGVLVAGSIDTKHDLPITAALINKHADRKFLVVPHEVDQKHIQKVLSKIKVKTLLYSQCTESTDFTDVNVLIVDYVGDLAKIYRYGHFAYVGGGFTPLLHSVVEPAVYGLPVSFGPRINRKAAPQLMMKCGIGQMVCNAHELEEWYSDMLSDPQHIADINAKAKEFVHSSAGKTAIVVREIG